jgi:FlaA1/EpsC-like NDP-sugar epimerase
VKISELKDEMIFRSLVLLACYSVIITLSLWLAYELRFDFEMKQQYWEGFKLYLSWIIPIKLAFLAMFGQFSGLLSYFSIPDLKKLISATALSSLVLFIIWYWTRGAISPPRGVLLADFIITLFGLAAVRLSFRILRERYLAPFSKPLKRHAKRVGIVGAGDVGAALAKDLLTKRGLGLEPTVFFDDDKRKWKSKIHDIPVIGPPELLANDNLNLNLEEVIIAMPSAPAKRIGEVVKILQQSRLPFTTVPAMDQLATGKVRVSQLRPVEIQDLLNRSPVKLETDSIRKIINEKVVMVTGAGGSIGSELVRQIAGFNPTRLIMVDQSEVQMFQIEQEMISLGYGGTIVPAIADINDKHRMTQLFERYEPKIIFHAAAHKHVPLMEMQPAEAIHNNTIGTITIAKMALEHDVEKFIMISTDKAINPTSVMGATKRLAEIYIQALHAENPNKTKFIAVRFGNVLGSSGSVVTVFQKQIAAGGPVKVTHPEVTRFFMTIPEAVGLVLQSGAQGAGGEIFVLDMGEPIKILDLARQLIELNGLRPDEDIEIEFTGLRPGEKLFEEIAHKGEKIKPTTHSKILRFVCEPMPLDKVNELINEITNDMYNVEPSQLKLRLKKAIPEYQPYL